MKRAKWKAITVSDSAHRRAGGRRRYNAMRTAAKEERQALLVDIFGLIGLRGQRAKAARYFGVSRATITRDVRAILRRKRACDLEMQLAADGLI